MLRAVESAEPLLPTDKPRYAMGLGTPPQMLQMIARGMDMMDEAALEGVQAFIEKRPPRWNKE